MNSIKKNEDHTYPPSTWLNYFRSRAGLTQAELAKLSGVNSRQIQRVELGTSLVGNLTAKNLFALADALGVDARSLLRPYPLFCGDCGNYFTSEIPLRNQRGMLNDISCPTCGGWNVYPDTPEGAAQSVRDEIAYQNEVDFD